MAQAWALTRGPFNMRGSDSIVEHLLSTLGADEPCEHLEYLHIAAVGRMLHYRCLQDAIPWLRYNPLSRVTPPLHHVAQCPVPAE